MQMKYMRTHLKHKRNKNGQKVKKMKKNGTKMNLKYELNKRKENIKIVK